MSNTSTTATGAGNTAAHNVNINDLVWQVDRKFVLENATDQRPGSYTTVAWVEHNGTTDWWRIAIDHNPNAAYCQHTYWVINSKGEIVGRNRPYLHNEQKGISLPGEWSHKAARAAAELASHYPVGIPREEFIKLLVRDRQTITVKVSMTVTVQLTPGMLNHATRAEIAEDIRERSKVGAANHLGITGITATVA